MFISQLILKKTWQNILGALVDQCRDFYAAMVSSHS